MRTHERLLPATRGVLTVRNFYVTVLNFNRRGVYNGAFYIIITTPKTRKLIIISNCRSYLHSGIVAITTIIHFRITGPYFLTKISRKIGIIRKTVAARVTVRPLAAALPPLEIIVRLASGNRFNYQSTGLPNGSNQQRSGEMRNCSRLHGFTGIQFDGIRTIARQFDTIEFYKLFLWK